MIFITLLCILSICYACFYYSRRNLYKHAAKIPAMPLMGCFRIILNVEDVRQTLHTMLNQYGYTFKAWMFWICLVIVADPKHLKTILTSPHCLNKEKRYGLFKDVLGDGLIIVPAQKWKHHRKLLTPAFSKKVVDSFFQIFVKHSEILVQQLEREADRGKVFDANEYTSKCALDFICDTAMGVSVDAQVKKSKLLDITCRIAEILVLRALKVWFHPSIIFKASPLGKEFYKICEVMRTFTNDIVNQRMDEMKQDSLQGKPIDDDKKKPFLDHLLTMEEKLSFTDLCNEVAQFVVAGSDTVATTVEYTLVSLGMHKEVQKKLREEIVEVFGDSGRPIEMSDLPKLEYLTRVLKETLRMYPPIPIVARGVTENIDLGDFILPKDCSVVIPLSGVHRNPEYWDDPLKFDPDRFLPENFEKQHPYSYLPFSGGPRNCIGYTYAMVACKIILATVLMAYKVDTTITPETIRFKTGVTSKIVGGSNITISRV